MRCHLRPTRRLLLLALCILSAGGMQRCGNGYWPWERTPDRSFRVEELLIVEEDLPPGWHDELGPMKPPNAPLGHYSSIERTYRSFDSKDGPLTHTVHRFASVGGASREFRRLEPLGFSESEGPWGTSALSYESQVADQYHLACNAIYCLMMAQYGEYFVELSARKSRVYMTYEDMRRVLIAVDERMAFYLGKDDS